MKFRLHAGDRDVNMKERKMKLKPGITYNLNINVQIRNKEKKCALQIKLFGDLKTR